MQAELIGQVIKNNYHILNEIARGGMATVYRAHQLSMNRDVAVKVLPREFLHEASFRERFRQEADIAARLEHRAIVPVYDYDEWQGISFIVMRLMEGKSVDNLLLAGPISLEQTQRIIRQVASALDYAHAHGVLHRDLKPSNILLDRNGDAYITDFGIARILTSNQQLTSTGVVGTPAYMSPEQAQGLELDSRSDIYALGVLIFEMLTARRPFEGDTPYSTAVMHVTKAPPSPRSFNPAIPLGVEAVILKSLAKDRELRYRSAIELAGALEDADLLPAMATLQRPLSTPPTPAPAPPPAPPAVLSPNVMPHPPLILGTDLGRPRPRRRGMAVWWSVPLAVLGVVLLGVGVLAAYWFLTDRGGGETLAPNFAATGEFRLTATAAGDVSLPGGPAGQVLLIGAESEGDFYRLSFPPQNLLRLTDNAGAEGQAALSPDGSRLAFVYDPDGDLQQGQNETADIYISLSNGQEAIQITRNLFPESSPVWLDDQTLVYIREEQQYWIIRYNLTNQQESILYQADMLLKDLRFIPGQDWLGFVSGAVGSQQLARLYLADGRVELLGEPSSFIGAPDWSLDWGWLYLGPGEGGTALWAWRADQAPQVLYDGPGLEARPQYQPNGEGLLFAAQKSEGAWWLWWLPNEGGQEAQSLVPGREGLWLP